MKNLELKVILNAVDKITSPLRGVQKQLDKLQDKVKGATGELNKLKQQEKTANSFKRLSDELQQSNHKLVKAKAAAKQLEQQLKNTVNPTAKLKKQVSDAYKQANKMAQAQEQQRKKLNQLRQSLRQGGFDTAKFKKSQEELKAKIEQSTAAIDKQNVAMKKLQQRQARKQAYRNNVETLKTNSERLRNMGQKAMLAGSAGNMTAIAMLKPAVEFERSFSKVQALTRLDKVKDAKQIQALRQQALYLGDTTAFSSSEVADAQGYLAMAGFTPEQIQSSLKSVLNTALASGTDLARVSDIMSDVSSGFKIPAGEMQRVADVLTYTFTTSNTSIETLYETMKEGGPIMTSLGQSFESVAAMAGLMGNVGIKGSSAGTAFKNIGLNLIDNKHLKKLGISERDKKGVMRQLPEILADINKKTAKMGNAARAEIVESIFGKIGIAAALELLSQSDKALQEYENNIKQQSKDTAAKVATIMSDNLMGDLKSLNSAREAIGISIYDSVSAEIRSLIQDLTGLVRKVNEWIKANPELTAKIVKWAAAIAGTLTILGALSMLLSFVLYPVGRLILGFSHLTGITRLFDKELLKSSKSTILANKHLFSYKSTLNTLQVVKTSLSKKIIGLWGVIRNLPSAFILVINKVKKLSFWINSVKNLFKFAFSPLRFLFAPIVSAISFLLSPIGLLVAALIGAGVVIYRNWEKVRAFFGGFLEGLKSGLAPVLERFKPLGELFGIVVGWIKKAVKWFTDLLTPVKSISADLDSAAAAGKKFGEWLAAGIDLVTKPLQWLMDSIKWVIDNMPSIETQEKAMSKAMTQNNTAGQLFMAGSGIEDVPAVNKWSGGYAGNGGKYQPKGIFHGGEYIMTKEATSRLGVPLLNALNYGKNAMLTAGLGVSVATAQPIKVDNRPPLTAKSQTTQTASQPMQVTININAQQGQSAVDIAKEVEKALRNLENQKQARARSALRDRD
ncbi:phage tail tape measure protein [Avibacterium avium]|uniref:phage tail tape measure protein n=1 Tax=Avibacterium avium TaxID=751 RepID=UPI003BF91A1D